MYLQLILKGSEFYSHGSVVYHAEKPIVTLPNWMLKIRCFSLLQRLTREKIHQVLVVENKLVVLTKGLIRVYSLTGEWLAEFVIERGSRPLRQGVQCVGNTIIYGDYWRNTNREPVNLYQIDLVTFERKIISVFEHVRHIHCVQADARDSRYVFVGTGDSNQESGIYQVELSSGNYEVLAGGAQRYRVVSFIQDGDVLFWGSDSPATKNAIYRFDLANRDDAQPLISIDGPAYYSTVSADNMFYIATAIEDRQRHKAIIYRSVDKGRSWQPYRCFKKDIWSEKWFGYGIVEFPGGHEHARGLHYNLCGLKEITGGK